MFRRDVRLFLRCVLASLVLLAGVTLLGAGAVRLLSGEGNLYTPVKIAVVDEEDSITSRILVRTVRNLEAFAAVLDAEVMTEEDALRAFDAGEAAAVVILPDEFVSDILSGSEGGGRILYSAALASQAEMVEAVADFGGTLLAAGQYGVFAGESLIDSRGLDPEVRSGYLDRSNKSLLDEAMNRSFAYFTDEPGNRSGEAGRDLAEHYALCWLTFALFLSAVFFLPLFRSDASSPLIRRMSTLGVGPARYLGTKIGFTTAYRFLAALGGFFLISRSGILPEGNAGAGFWLSFLVCSLLCALFLGFPGACLSLCFGGGVAEITVAAGAGLILCGGIIPRPLLPRWLLRIGDLTPFGAARGLLLPALGGGMGPAFWTSVTACLVYAALSAVLLRFWWKKTLAGEEET